MEPWIIYYQHSLSCHVLGTLLLQSVVRRMLCCLVCLRHSHDRSSFVQWSGLTQDSGPLVDPFAVLLFFQLFLSSRQGRAFFCPVALLCTLDLYRDRFTTAPALPCRKTARCVLSDIIRKGHVMGRVMGGSWLPVAYGNKLVVRINSLARSLKLTANR